MRPKEPTKEYKRGYTKGVTDLRSRLIKETNKVLVEEKNKRDETLPMCEMEWANNQGWIECLEMFLFHLDGGDNGKN